MEDRLANLFPTLWQERDPGRPGSSTGYFICERRSWGYNGAMDSAEHSIYELEVRCTRAQHPLIQAWYVANQDGAWPRILGWESQGLQGAQRNPQAMLLSFNSPQKREEFKKYWAELDHE